MSIAPFSFGHPLVAVVGPTGAGKSELALRLAELFGGEIVNCDSVQVYRRLDIGSAKTPVAQRMGIRHHLLDIAEPDQELTAGVYAQVAGEALNDIRAGSVADSGGRDGFLFAVAAGWPVAGTGAQ